MKNSSINTIRITPSSKIFNKLGYEYLGIYEEPSEPDYTDVKFSDVLPELRSSEGRAQELANKRLYAHQLKTIEALSKGKNVILISGTGSGKTEAWAIYALREKLKVLAVYPTLALSQDQIDRLKSYYSAAGVADSVIEVDRPFIDKIGGPKKAINKISNALLVITNPAFLMADLKRIASGSHGTSRSILLGFLKDVDLIIIDELDYYGSKGATLLLALVELLEKYTCDTKPQIVILTATLGNPEELKEYLTRINDRDTEIIRGKAFRIKNFTYLVLGKNIKKIWNAVHSNKTDIKKKIPEIIPLIEDFETFRDYIFNVIELLKEHGFNVPELDLDITEILTEYVMSNETCVTIVFTPSIRSAETLAKKLRSTLMEKLNIPEKLANMIIATHHHLIDADKRRIIENNARSGKTKIIFTVRTLLQGIDIGTVARIVHYGVPEDIREFKQREGRKGRRKEFPFSESIIIPIKPWDRKLVELGAEGLKEYLSLPLENIYVNPNNKYVLLFKTLFKVRKATPNITNEELKLLEDLGLIKYMKGLFKTQIPLLSDTGKDIWKKLNFYGYGPPYGINRILVEKNKGEIPLGDTVSWRDLIEKYQPGCFDYSYDTIVVKIRRGPTIVEQKIFDAIRNHGFLADAYEQYKAIKMQWGEDPNLLRDFDTGKLTSTVQCHVVIPIDGFGIFIKEPECVLWELESRKPKLIKADNEYKMIYDTKFIYINSRVKGKYTDFTYGYMYELDPDEDTDKLRIGLAFLKIALRLSDYRISLNEINYAVEDFPRKAMLIWENECCGLLETINWNNIRKFLENFKPSKICELLMWAVDEYAALRMVELGTSWDEIKKLAHRALDYIQRILRLKLKTLGAITIPKPSMELKLLALDILPLTLNDNTYYIITSFDGQNYHHVILRFYGSNMQTSFPTISNVNDLLTTISNAIDKDFKILIYNQKEPLHKIAKSSKTLQMLIKTLEDNNLLIDVHKMTKETLNVDIAPIEELEKYLGLQKRKITLPELRKAYHEAITQKRAETLLEKATEYGKSNAYSTYIVYLILQQKSAN